MSPCWIPPSVPESPSGKERLHYCPGMTSDEPSTGLKRNRDIACHERFRDWLLERGNLRMKNGRDGTPDTSFSSGQLSCSNSCASSMRLVVAASQGISLFLQPASGPGELSMLSTCSTCQAARLPMVDIFRCRAQYLI